MLKPHFMGRIPEYAVLIHTFDGYAFAWDGFVQGWKDSRMDFLNAGIPVYWGSDVKSSNNPPFTPIYSGKGEWSDRLKLLLKIIPSHTIFYMQEDHWPKKGIYLDFFYQIFRNLNLKRLQISPVNQYYSLYGGELPLFFHEKAKSKYLIAHNPSFWDKSFLISVLKNGQSPWQHEYEATCKLWECPQSIRKKIAIYPCDWYHHAVEKGKLTQVK
jgi:hypothetical protein